MVTFPCFSILGYLLTYLNMICACPCGTHQVMFILSYASLVPTFNLDEISLDQDIIGSLSFLIAYFWTPDLWHGAFVIDSATDGSAAELDVPTNIDPMLALDQAGIGSEGHTSYVLPPLIATLTSFCLLM